MDFPSTWYICGAEVIWAVLTPPNLWNIPIGFILLLVDLGYGNELGLGDLYGRIAWGICGALVGHWIYDAWA